MRNLKNTLVEYLGLLAGCTLMAIGLNMFFVPFTIAPGGLSGLSIVINKLTGISVSTLLFVMSALLLVFSVKILGKKDALKTLVGLLVLTVMLKITEPLISSNITNDILVSAIAGAIFVGLGLGILFSVDASTGGTDLIALMINRIIPSVPVSKCLSVIDGSVVVFAGIVSKNIETGLYSAISLYIIVKVVDSIISGFDYSKAFFIISDKRDVLQSAILNDLNRGITILDAKGGYTNEDKSVLLVVVNNKKQEIGLKKLVKKVDENSFIIVTDVYEVLGQGFTSISEV